MAFSAKMGIPEGRDPMSDVVFRAQKASQARVDPTGKYYTEKVTIDGGPKNARTREVVNLKIAYDEPFAYAVYKDNPAFHDRDQLEWDAAATNALEKFAATNGLQVKMGPIHEHGSRYNYQVEYNRVIKYQPETLEHLRQRREAREAAEADMARANELRRLLGANEGMRL